MMESSQGVLRLCRTYFNHIEYCTLSELKGVLEHSLNTPLDKENKSDDPAEDVPPAADGKSGNDKLTFARGAAFSQYHRVGRLYKYT